MMSFSQPISLSFFLIAVYLKVCVCQAINCTNCCSNATYTEINEPRRSIKSFWQQGQPVLCDRSLRSGWYRFISDAGGKVMMPEASVPEYHCGTHDPIWLNGSHPTVAEGNVVRQGCISSFGVVCDDTIDINVTNCGDYYVYYLRPTFYCAVAYCAGDMIPCPYGKEGVHPNCFDIVDCVNHTCQHGGSCIDGGNNYSCNCLPGFLGDRCETDIDECVNNTCSNGGSCVDGINNYTCKCKAGFIGDRCQTAMNSFYEVMSEITKHKASYPYWRLTA